MRVTIGNSMISQIKTTGKAYDIRDNKLKGFIVRVSASGTASYVCQYGRGKRITFGNVGVLTPAQARDLAREVLADVVKGTDPKIAKQQAKNYSFQDFLEVEYKPWAEVNQKRGGESVTRIKIHFLKDFANAKLQDITPLDIERWRTKRFQSGMKATTINRDIAALKAALSKAVEWNFIETNPLTKFKLSRIDTLSIVRYLNKEEEKRLRQAIDDRDEKLKAARERGNIWRKARGKLEMLDLRSQLFADRIKPMILLSINTGIRKGELLSLTWDDIDFKLATLTIKAEAAKSGKTRHIPLNAEALAALQGWLKQVGSTKLVFPGEDNKPLSDVKKSWATILRTAEINNFRWHDLRHHFASRLVMASVDLNTVRELLGHADIKMTLRYAHLAPEHKAEAVARLMTN